MGDRIPLPEGCLVDNTSIDFYIRSTIWSLFATKIYHKDGRESYAMSIPWNNNGKFTAAPIPKYLYSALKKYQQEVDEKVTDNHLPFNFDTEWGKYL
jgi:hypothetical protein